MATDYLERILNACVYDVAIESPLEPAAGLSRRLRNRVLLKREDLQPIFSFKLRGAYNKMARLAPDALARGVAAASAGNHAQGVALAAQRLRCPATIVMPVTTPQIKVDAVAALGAEVVLDGDSYEEAYAHAAALAAERSLTFVHPYDDPDVIAGQGTIGMEILRQCREPLRALFVPVGGGGLIGGIATYVKRLRPDIGVIGVEPEDANAMERSLRARRRVELSHVGLFAEGVAVRQVGARRSGCAQTLRRRRRPGDDRRALRRDQGRVRGHAHGRRAVRGARRRRRQALGRADGRDRRDVRRGRLGRQRELRPSPLRHRACRARRATRGRVRGHDSRAARQLQDSSAVSSASGT